MKAKTLTAKILKAYFAQLDPKRDYHGNIDEELSTSLVLEFSNGLILLPSQTTADDFVANKNDIERGGNEQLIKTEDTGKKQEWQPFDLLLAYRNYWAEFGAYFDKNIDQDPCSKLVEELVGSKVEEKKEVTFYFTARSQVTLELTKEEIEALEAAKPNEFYREIINRACNENDEQTSKTAPGWELDDDPEFTIDG